MFQVRPRWNPERLEWDEAVRIRSFLSNLSPTCLSDVNWLVNSGQSTRTKHDTLVKFIAQLIFAAGPLYSLTLGQGGEGTVTWAAIAPDTENSFTRQYIARLASRKTGLATQVTPSGQI